MIEGPAIIKPRMDSDHAGSSTIAARSLTQSATFLITLKITRKPAIRPFPSTPRAGRGPVASAATARSRWIPAFAGKNEFRESQGLSDAPPTIIEPNTVPFNKVAD